MVKIADLFLSEQHLALFLIGRCATSRFFYALQGTLNLRILLDNQDIKAKWDGVGWDLGTRNSPVLDPLAISK